MKKLIMMIVALLGFLGVSSGMALADSTRLPVYLENGQAVEAFSRDPLSDRQEIRSAGNGWNRLLNHTQGFSLLYPETMQPDVSLSAVRTLLTGATSRVEIYHDILASPAGASPQAYINYGNRFRSNGADHRILEDTYLTINGYSVHLLRWERSKLARVKNDYHHYVSAEIVTGPSEVYTLVFESSQPVDYYRAVLESFATLPRQGSPGFWAEYAPTARNWNEETSAWYRQFLGEDSPLTWGIFEPTAPFSFTYLRQLEKRFSYQFPILLVYQSLDSEPPLPLLRKAYQEGRTVELTLQTSSERLSQVENHGLPYDILAGTYDAFLHDYARQLKEFGHPVLFRLNNEMNGDWCSYAGYHTSRDADVFIALWRYLHEMFAQEGADNVIWVWNPNDISFPDFKWNHAFLYYPGNDYVDVVGLTGYNTGTYYPGERWREFAHIYDPLYRLYSGVFAHPFMITEFGSNSVGGDKAAWIDGMFGAVSKYPRIKAAIWWSGTDWDKQNRPARIYRIDETGMVMDAFARGLKQYPTEP